MIGKAFNSFKTKLGNNASSIQSTQLFETQSATKVEPEGLPMAPLSAFRKRPVKLTYDKNEFHMFRLPSEDGFLLGSFDSDEMFGKRKGIMHSPHIKAQTDLDSNLVWAIAGVTVLMCLGQMKTHATFKGLRDNFRTGDMGKFSEADFK